MIRTSALLKNTGPILMIILLIAAFTAIMMIWTRPSGNFYPVDDQSGAVEEQKAENSEAAADSSYRSMLRSIIVSLLLLSILLLIARYLKKNASTAAASNVDFQILGKKYLDQHNSVVLAKSYGRFLLLSMSDGGLKLITEIPLNAVPEDIEEEDKVNKNNYFSNILETLNPAGRS